MDDGDHTYIYGPSSTPIAQIDDAGTVEYLHTDLLGSVRLITDQDGDTAATSTFDEFGNRVHHTGTSDSSFGFTGAWTDADTGLVHLRARDYDPATGQFLTVDPAVDQTRQPYAYTGNNPLTRTDPTGLDAMSDAIGRGAMGLILGPGSLRVMDELNAGTDLWSSINMGYNPVYIAIERYDSFRASGNDWWAAGVMAFNPVYDVIAGFDKGLTGIQNECVEDTVTGFTQTLAGLVGTGLIAVGGVASFRSSTGSTGAAPTASSGLHSPSFVVKPNGETVVVPAGAVGPTPATGSGFQFTGGSGGPGLSLKTTDVRIMDPVTSGPYQHPAGYASYSNVAGQTVNPHTGRTIPRTDPNWHMEFTR